MSCGPATKNGSMIRSLASAQMRIGDGNVAPGFMHRICQIVRMRANVISGGSTVAAVRVSAGTSRDFT